MHLEQLLIRYKSLVDLLEKINEMGGAYDFVENGYPLQVEGISCYPAFQFDPDPKVRFAIQIVANAYALLGDQTGLGMFSFLILNWEALKTGEDAKINNVLTQLKM